MSKYEIIEIILLVFSIIISIIAIIVSFVQSKKSNDIANNANEKAEFANKNAQEANELSKHANDIADNANYIAKESVIQNKKLSLLSERKKFYFDLKNILSSCKSVFDLIIPNSIDSKFDTEVALLILETLLPDNFFIDVIGNYYNLDNQKRHDYLRKKVTLFENMSIDSDFLFGDDVGQVVSNFLMRYFNLLRCIIDFIYYQDLQNKKLNDNSINKILDIIKNIIDFLFDDLKKQYNSLEEGKIMDKIKDIIKIDIENKENNND